MRLPKHTFYVDNIYAYYPLPHVRKIYYLDVDFYRYFIGREDQSVNEKVMIARPAELLRYLQLTMIDMYRTKSQQENRDSMTNYPQHDDGIFDSLIRSIGRRIRRRKRNCGCI